MSSPLSKGHKDDRCLYYPETRHIIETMGGEEHKFTVRKRTGARQQMLSRDKNSPALTICDL